MVDNNGYTDTCGRNVRHAQLQVAEAEHALTQAMPEKKAAAQKTLDAAKSKVAEWQAKYKVRR